MVTNGPSRVNDEWGATPLAASRVGSMNPDPFDVLGVAPRFDLGHDALERAYLARSADLHPDAAADPDAPRMAASLNEAKRALDDPERRAEALLLRLGGPSKESDRSLPVGFLPEIMEVRESAEQARALGDRGTLGRWEDWAERKREGYIRSVGERFAGLPPRPSPADLKALRVELNAWRYIERMIEQLDPDFDPGRDATPSS
jgi:molecular chaperone HscB